MMNEGITNALAFGLQLGLVIHMLPFTSTACSEVEAARCRAEVAFSKNLIDSRLRITLLLPDDACSHPITWDGAWNEHDPAIHMRK